MRKLLMIVSLLVLASCATKSVMPENAKPIPENRITSQRYQIKSNTTSTLTFIRDSGFYGSGVSIYLYINGEEIAQFRPSEKYQIFLEPGEYLLGVQQMPNFGLEQFIENPFEIKASKKYYFRLSIHETSAVVKRTSKF